ncbi:hypothetical protein VZG28_04750 [Synechococcus elongatus IITB4]|uniref:A1S_2505 family phage non-structural protein n=1 Tax=Synechococcus elongatus TaxID=32046 RepID=UPI0030CE0910
MSNQPIESEWRSRLARSLSDPGVLAAGSGMGALAGYGVSAIANGDQEERRLDPGLAAIVGSLSVPALGYGLGRLFGRNLPPAKTLDKVAKQSKDSPQFTDQDLLELYEQFMGGANPQVSVKVPMNGIDLSDPVVQTVIRNYAGDGIPADVAAMLGPDMPSPEILSAIAKTYMTETPQTPAPRTRRPDIKGRITKLEPNQVFVFGSNVQGKHGAGAAKDALKYFGAEYGNPRGPQGQSYAIITKDLSKGDRSVPLDDILDQLEELATYAGLGKEEEFLLTPVGTGLGGYSIEELKAGVAERGIVFPENITFVNW